MHIRNVTLEDDSLFGHLGSYECHAFAVGDAVVMRGGAWHGFSVSVIESKYTSYTVKEAVPRLPKDYPHLR